MAPTLYIILHYYVKELITHKNPPSSNNCFLLLVMNSMDKDTVPLDENGYPISPINNSTIATKKNIPRPILISPQAGCTSEILIHNNSSSNTEYLLNDESGNSQYTYTAVSLLGLNRNLLEYERDKLLLDLEYAKKVHQLDINRVNAEYNMKTDRIRAHIKILDSYINQDDG